MRILQVNINYSGTGADRCARELFEELPKIGIETEMWVSDPGVSHPDRVSSVRYSWERWLFPLEAFPDLTDWRHRGSIRRLNSVAHKDFDLVHLHIIHSGWISIRAIHQLTKRFPCIWTLHDEWAPNRGITYDLTGKRSAAEVKQLSRGLIRHIPYHRYHENFKWRRTRSFLEKWMPEPRVVICPSRYMTELARTSGAFPGSEIVHIPNGTRMPDAPNAAMDRVEAKRSFGLTPDRPVVLMVSADLAQAHKGVDLGIKAIRGVDRSLGVQSLLLGRSGQQIADAISPIQSISVYASDDATLARAYRAADVTLIPSLGENYPYVALESLACATPVLAFQIGGLPEMLGKQERGVICRAIDAAEMGKHLERLLADAGSRVEMGERGAAWVRQECGMSRYISTVAELYKRVLSGTPSPESTPGFKSI